MLQGQEKKLGRGEDGIQERVSSIRATILGPIPRIINVLLSILGFPLASGSSSLGGGATALICILDTPSMSQKSQFSPSSFV